MGMYAKFLVLLLLLAFGVWWVHEPYQDYRQTRGEVQRLDERLLKVAEETEELRKRIHALKTDPRAIERIAREKFGYCRPNETIYDFSAPVLPR